jgi:polyisoprenoid-binding protein YceI
MSMKTAPLFALVAFGALALPALADISAHLDPPHSSATFSVRHLTLTKVSGTIVIKEATIVLGDDHSLKEADATLDLATIDTGTADRDRDLRSARWFDVADYPLMTFKSTSIAPGANGSTHVTGDLSFHGITKPVSFDAAYTGTVTDGRGQTHVGYSAIFTLDRTNWNLGPGFPALIVGHDVTIDIEVDAIEG